MKLVMGDGIYHCMCGKPEFKASNSKRDFFLWLLWPLKLLNDSILLSVHFITQRQVNISWQTRFMFKVVSDFRQLYVLIILNSVNCWKSVFYRLTHACLFTCSKCVHIDLQESYKYFYSEEHIFTYVLFVKLFWKRQGFIHLDL